MRYFLLLLVALLGAGAAHATCADPATCSCTVGASGLSFGTYDPQAPSPSDSVGTVSITCTSADPGGSTLSVALGSGGSGNVAQREMRRGASVLDYNLYTNASRSVIWGDDAAGGSSVVASFPSTSGGERRLNIYGRIVARQNAVPGGYSDTIVVTVTY